jgi:outer membrane immunogenic protein
MLGGAAPAFAADLPVYKAPIVAPVVFSWTGFYVGGNVGYSWGRASTDQTDLTTTTTTTRLFRGTTPPANEIIGPSIFTQIAGVFPQVTTATALTGTSGSTNVNGFIGGGQAGFNYQSGVWVWGFETDLQWSGERGSFNTCDIAGCPPGSTFGSASTRLNWYGTARGRVGWVPTQRVLLYATGGLAYGGISSDYVSGINGNVLTATSASTTRVGWTVGAGAEAALDNRWSVKAEYLYMDFGSFGTALGGAVGAATTTTTLLAPFGPTLTATSISTVSAQVNTRFTDHVFRVGVNYRFGVVDAPVTTKY